MGTEGTAQPEQPAPQAEPERLIWKTHPSQFVHLGAYLVCFLILAFLIAAFFLVPHAQPFFQIGFGVVSAIVFFVVLVKWIRTRARTYQVTSERIKVTDGVFSRKTEEIELYRVRDYKLTEPFWLRLFGLGNIVISTTDNSSPILVIEAIRDPNGHREEIRKYVELCRDRKHVRIREMEA